MHDGEREKSIFLPTSPSHCLTLNVPVSHREGSLAEGKAQPWIGSGFLLVVCTVMNLEGAWQHSGWGTVHLGGTAGWRGCSEDHGESGKP